MKVNFRQGIVSHQASGFLQISGNVIHLLADNRPVTITLAHKDTNYTHSEDRTVNNAWVGPFTETKYWLYWDFNPLTFERTFGYTTLEPVAQSSEPGTGNVQIVGAIPGDPGIGSFVIDGYYVLPLNKQFQVINSTSNNGNYSVKSSSYNQSTGQTTIVVNEQVLSNIADGEATLDIDSDGIPLYTDGRHWFNTYENVHYVLEGNIWRPVIRLFAALLYNGTTFVSVSQNAASGDFTGTQIGNNSDAFSGRVLFDEASNPIRRDNGTFFTTEDQFFTNQSRVDAIRLESNVARAQSISSSISKFSVVAWKDDGKVDLAQYSDIGNTVLGILTEDLLYDEVGSIIIQGVITNPDWNWTTGATPVPVGSELWVNNGELVVEDPHVTDPITYPQKQVPVARVLDKDTIIFEQGLGGVGPQGPRGIIEGLTPADTTNLGAVTLVTPSSDPNRAFVISDTDSRLTNARPPLPHTHQASDVTVQPVGGLVSNNAQSAFLELDTNKLNLSGGTMVGPLLLSGNPTTDAEATTKRYVDSLVNGLIWLEPIHGVNLIGDNLTDPPVNPNHGDMYIMPAGTLTGDWSTAVAGDVMQWDENTSTWDNLGPIVDMHGGELRVGISMRSDTLATGSFFGRDNEIALFDATGTLSGFETPSLNNAVYVDSDASLFAYDQYVYDGTNWIKFGGAAQAIVGDALTIDVTGGVVSAIPTSTGGQIDALTLVGNSLADLDLRWALSTHTHNGTDVLITSYTGNGRWGTPVGNDGQLVATNVGDALIEISDNKADKTPLYASTTDLPDYSTEKGMVAVVDNENTVFFADDTGWTALSRADHTHTIPYDMAFYVHGTLYASQRIGIFAITRDVFVDVNAPNSVAVCGKPATSLPTTILIQKDVSPYGTPIDIGTIVFDPGSYVGNITWTAGISFSQGDMLVLSTDASPSDVEEISVTIVGCATAYSCTLPSPPVVDFIPPSQPYFFDNVPITGNDGSVNITGTFTSILWTQSEYSEDGVTWFPAPGTGTLGDLIFSDPTIQVPNVAEAAGGRGLYYRVKIEVTGPGGVAFDEEIIKFAGY